MGDGRARDPDLGRLARVMARLRAPEGGCPWDLAQDLASMRPHLLEEAYEVLDVMAGPDADAHREELGDLLFQVVFQARLREEQGAFDLADVVDGICEKLERRHPHVFGDEAPRDAAAVEARWHELKQAEGKGGVDDVPRALPALARAAGVGRKAARVGFDWPAVDGPLAKLDEEAAELREAVAGGDAARVAAELGDLLFAAVNVARHVGVDPELALGAATDRFVARFRRVEGALAAEGRTAREADVATLDALWERAKAELG